MNSITLRNLKSLLLEYKTEMYKEKAKIQKVILSYDEVNFIIEVLSEVKNEYTT
jgi:hypothetical protein